MLAFSLFSSLGSIILKLPDTLIQRELADPGSGPHSESGSETTSVSGA